MYKPKKIPKKLFLEMKDSLKYNKNTGIFTWAKNRGSNKMKGKKAGSLNKAGYIIIKFYHKDYKASRLAYFFVHGLKNQHLYLDHKDGNKSNDKIKNIRLCKHRINMQNHVLSSKVNKTGYLGVTKLRSGIYQAQISIKNVTIYLGVFNTGLKAHKCYLKAKRKMHKGCTI